LERSPQTKSLALDSGGEGPISCSQACRGRLDIVLVYAWDRIARCPRHSLGELHEPNRLDVELVWFKEALNTTGPLCRAIVVLIGVVAELERTPIVERGRAGMRLVRSESRLIGRLALKLNRQAIAQHSGERCCYRMWCDT